MIENNIIEWSNSSFPIQPYSSGKEKETMISEYVWIWEIQIPLQKNLFIALLIEKHYLMNIKVCGLVVYLMPSP